MKIKAMGKKIKGKGKKNKGKKSDVHCILILRIF